MDTYIGTIVAFAGNFEPQDWKICNGQQLSITEYQALYSLIGTTYGGDGMTYFCLPNLQNRLVVGTGQGPGLTARTLGQTGGSDTVTLTVSNLPQHTHTLTATTSNGTSSAPGSSYMLAAISDATKNFYDSNTDPANLQALNAVSMQPAGNGQEHQNKQPYMAINYIMCVNGLYPPFY